MDLTSEVVGVMKHCMPKESLNEVLGSIYVDERPSKRIIRSKSDPFELTNLGRGNPEYQKV